jgi:ribose transport system substrate-binding protein
MSKARRAAAMLLIGSWTAVMAAGCGTGSRVEMRNAGSYTEDGKPVITVITKAMESSYWNMVQAGALLAGSDLGYTIHLLGPNEEENVQAEIDEIAEAQKDSAALVIAPNDPNILVSPIADAHAAGIPIVILDSNLPDDTAYDAFTGTNNYAAGEALGEYIGTQQTGAVAAIITGAAESKTHQERANGIIAGLEAEGCTVLELQAADSDRKKAADAASSLLERYPEITALIATSDDMALGAYEVADSIGRTDTVRVYGFDASVEGVQSILRGELTASAAQCPIQMGRDGIALADRILNGKPVEQLNETPFDLVTAQNAKTYFENIRSDMEKAGIPVDF